MRQLTIRRRCPISIQRTAQRIVINCLTFLRKRHIVIYELLPICSPLSFQPRYASFINAFQYTTSNSSRYYSYDTLETVAFAVSIRLVCPRAKAQSNNLRSTISYRNRAFTLERQLRNTIFQIVKYFGFQLLMPLSPQNQTSSLRQQSRCLPLFNNQ